DDGGAEEVVLRPEAGQPHHGEALWGPDRQHHLDAVADLVALLQGGADIDDRLGVTSRLAAGAEAQRGQLGVGGPVERPGGGAAVDDRLAIRADDLRAALDGAVGGAHAVDVTDAVEDGGGQRRTLLLVLRLPRRRGAAHGDVDALP